MCVELLTIKYCTSTQNKGDFYQRSEIVDRDNVAYIAFYVLQASYC